MCENLLSGPGWDGFTRLTSDRGFGFVRNPRFFARVVSRSFMSPSCHPHRQGCQLRGRQENPITLFCSLFFRLERLTYCMNRL